MRVSSHQFHNNAIKNIQTNASIFNEKSVQQATNQRLLKPSDDPLSAVMISNLNSEINSLEQYKTNMQAVEYSLGQQEVQLEGIVNYIFSLQSLITTTADGSLSDDDVKAIGEELSVTFPAIVDLLNATDSAGNYYFSGSQTDTKPFEVDAVTGLYTYNGDNLVRDIAVSDDSSILNNIIGDDLDPGAGFLNDMAAFLVDVNNPPAGGVGTQSRDMLDSLSGFLETISSQVTIIGGSLSTIETMTITNEDISTFSVNLRDDVSSVDFAETQVALEESVAAYQAAMQVYSKVSELSLFSYI